MVAAPGPPVSLKSLVYPATGSSISVWQGYVSRGQPHSKPEAGHNQRTRWPGQGLVPWLWSQRAGVRWPLCSASDSCVTEHLPSPPTSSHLAIWGIQTGTWGLTERYLGKPDLRSLAAGPQSSS